MRDADLELIGLDRHPLPVLDTAGKVEKLREELERAVATDAKKWATVRRESWRLAYETRL